MQEEEDDWETMEVEIPDFIKILEERKLAERKLVEEEDNQLTNDLFNPIEPPIKKELKETKTQQRQQTQQTQQNNRPKKPIPFINLNNAKALKERKEIIKRRKEIFGEPEIDIYEEQYGHIADI